MEETKSHQTEEQAHFDHFYSVTGCHAWHTYKHIPSLSLSLSQTHTHRQKYNLTLSSSHMRSHKRTYMHALWYTTVVKHEAWILVNQSACQTERQSVSALFFTRLIFLKVSVRRLACDRLILSGDSSVFRSQSRCGGRHSEEWHHSLLKLKDKNASSKHLKKF